MKRFQQLRKEIDKLDSEILRLLGKRFSLTRKIGKIKQEIDLPIKDAKRESLILEKGQKQAKKLGINPIFWQKIQKIILTESKKENRKISFDKK